MSSYSDFRSRDISKSQNEQNSAASYRCVAWGGNEHGQCDVPSGRFTQVAAGCDHSIGLREDGTIDCWGRNIMGQCDAPEGVFKSVAANGWHSLAIREDGSVAYWGRRDGESREPEGVFVQLAAGGSHSVLEKMELLLAGGTILVVNATPQ